VKKLIAVFFSLVTLTSNGQFKLKFTSKGLLSTIEKNKDNTLSANSIDEAGLVKAAFDELHDKFVKTASSFTEGPMFIGLYNIILPSAKLEGYQKDLEIIAAGNYRGIPAASIYYTLAKELEKLKTAKIFDFNAASGTLTHTNTVNQFLIDYYNATLALPGNAIVKSLTLRDYIRYSDFITTSYNNLSGAMSLARKVMSESNRVNLENALSYSGNAIMIKIDTLLSKPWFWQWAWYTDGVPRLNPLEFANNGFFDKYPEYDISKAAVLDEYLDTMIRRHIRLDTVEKVDDMKKLLAARGNSFKEFQFRDRIDKIKVENTANLTTVTQVNTVLNKVSIPKEKNKVKPFLYYSANKEFSGAYSDVGEEKVTAVDGKKTIVTFNVPKGMTVHLRETPVAFTDQTEFQKFTEGFSKDLTLLTPGLKQAAGLFATGYGSLIPTVHHVPTQFSTVPTAAEINSTRVEYAALLPGEPAPPPPTIADEAGELVKQFVTDKGVFNDIIFDSVKSTPAFINLLAATTRANRVDNIQKLIALYIEAYTMRYENLLEGATLDSTFLYGVANVIVNSTLPLTTLGPAPAGDPAYRTDIEETSSYDDPKTNNVRIVGVQQKDSVEIKTFKYNMGKRYRFQLGAGLAFSYPSPVYNTVTMSGSVASINQEKEYLKVIAGLNIYLGRGLFLLDNKVTFKDRMSLYLGVAFTRPLENVYTGVSWDIVPSVKLMMGAHWFAVHQYEIKNDLVASQHKEYMPYPFLSVTIDPLSFIQIINIFK
jgi:hypothetical protein